MTFPLSVKTRESARRSCSPLTSSGLQMSWTCVEKQQGIIRLDHVKKKPINCSTLPAHSAVSVQAQTASSSPFQTGQLCAGALSRSVCAPRRPPAGSASAPASDHLICWTRRERERESSSGELLLLLFFFLGPDRCS